MTPALTGGEASFTLVRPDSSSLFSAAFTTAATMVYSENSP